MSTIIQIFGGPSVGKSVLAADLYSFMKKSSKFSSVELIQEFAKELVWQERYEELKVQKIVTAGQIQKTMPLNGKVEYLITDSPLLLGLVYAEFQIDEVEKQILDHTAKFDRIINVLIERGDNVFESVGRIHDEQESKSLDLKIKEMLDSYGFEYTSVSRDDIAKIIRLI